MAVRRQQLISLSACLRLSRLGMGEASLATRDAAGLSLPLTHSSTLRPSAAPTIVLSLSPPFFHARHTLTQTLTARCIETQQPRSRQVRRRRCFTHAHPMATTRVRRQDARASTTASRRRLSNSSSHGLYDSCALDTRVPTDIDLDNLEPLTASTLPRAM